MDFPQPKDFAVVGSHIEGLSLGYFVEPHGALRTTEVEEHLDEFGNGPDNMARLVDGPEPALVEVGSLDGQEVKELPQGAGKATQMGLLAVASHVVVGVEDLMEFTLPALGPVRDLKETRKFMRF